MTSSMTKNFYQKSPSIQLFLKSISVGDIDKGECPTCGDKIGSFRDTLSEKEYSISGMCQSCQDNVFGLEEE